MTPRARFATAFHARGGTHAHLFPPRAARRRQTPRSAFTTSIRRSATLQPNLARKHLGAAIHVAICRHGPSEFPILMISVKFPNSNSGIFRA